MISCALLLFAGGCGAPEVEVPDGNKDSTSDKPEKALTAPRIEGAPADYPYPKLALRGSAGENAAVRVLVEGAGNPVTANIDPVNQTFCVNVDLSVSPAQYTLKIRSQSGDGKLSAFTEVSVNRNNGAAPPKNAKLCDGSPAGE